ncbi:retrovirus-related pol polyprotein from transposon TNT 1-94 [Tanacetum coccineum]
MHSPEVPERTAVETILNISNASTKYKGKEIAKPITPPSESAYKEDSDPEQAQRDKDMLKNLALIAKYFKKIYKPTNNNLRTSSNSKNKDVDTSLRYKNDNQTGQFRNQRTVTVAGARETIGSQIVQQTRIHCFNCKEFGHFAKECSKLKRVKDYTYHKEKMFLCKQAEKGVPLQAEQADWLEDTDEEIDEQELEAHYSYMAKIQEVPNADSGTDTEPLEKTELEMYKTLNDCTIDYDKLKRKLNGTLGLLAQKGIDIKEGLKLKAYKISVVKEKHDEELVDQAWEKHSNDHFRAPTAHDMEILIKTCLMSLALKTQNNSFKFVHELKQEMQVDLKYVESLEKEIDELESDKAEFSNMYDLLIQECVSNDVMCFYLHSLFDLDAHTELQCLYLHKVKECEFIAQKLSKQTETISKEVYNELSRSFAKLEKHSISLELILQQCQAQMKNDTVCKEISSTVFLKYCEQYFEIQDLKAQLQDKNIAIRKLKKLIEKCKGKSLETKFNKPSVVQQPNALRIPKPSVLGKSTHFSDSLKRNNFSKTKSIPKTNMSGGLSKPITTHILPQTPRQAVRNTNMIKPGMCRINTKTTQTRAPQLPQNSRNTNPCVSTSTRVNHQTNVSRLHLKSTQMKDKVVPNNSQVKLNKTEVEDHHRISSISNKTKSVTTCNDSLKSRTSNVNVVCATCGKCVFNLNHDACVSKFIHDVNARTKKPKVWTISTRQPKSQANKSVATPLKNTIVQLIIFIVDSGCTKHMTGNLKLLVYYVEVLNHNLFSVGQFCDADLEVAFWKSTCFVRDLQGNDLLTGNHGSDLYTISLQEMTSSTLICFMAKASPTQAWLWHRILSHLNFDYINLLSKKDIVIGLPKLKYVKDQLCSSCKLSKAKRSSFKTKVVPSSKGWLNLLHIDLCGPMRVESINEKKYILVIVDDYSRYTWTLFLRSKDETPEVLKDFLKMIQRNLQAQVITVRTDRGTEFLNKTLYAYFKEEGIEHQTSTPQTPEQNGVVKIRNRTLVETARTMLLASKLPLDGENLDKMKEKGDSCILVRYSTQSKGYRVYNKRTRLIVESIHLRFDEIQEMSETSVDNNTSGLVIQR